jgi:hypothetical protein
MFGRKKKRIRRIDLSKKISLPVLIRQIIYDSMLTPPEGIASLMELPPISEEVSDMEHQASEDRIEKIQTLLPFIDAHADIAARISAAAYRLEEPESEKMEEEELDQMLSLFRIVSLASAVSCVSTLVSLGFIESKVVSIDEL